MGTYLPQPVFSHGQLYVAASRCGERAGCFFLVYRGDNNVAVATNYTKNVVYNEALL